MKMKSLDKILLGALLTFHLGCQSRETVNVETDYPKVKELAFPDSSKYIKLQEIIVNFFGNLMNLRRFDSDLNQRADLYVMY